MKLFKQNGMATDSILLIFVRCITLLVGIIQTMILTRALSTNDYGTYSEGLLIISFISPFLSLGLNDSVNYFYNKGDNLNDRDGYINTIFALSAISGIVGAALLIIGRQPIAGYFKNPRISPLVFYIALRPCLANIIALYQPLYISKSLAKIVAIRNLMVSLLQVIVIWVTSAVIRDVNVIFITLLALDIGQLIFFDAYLRRNGSSVNIIKIEKKKIRPVLGFAMPMLLATSIGTINLNLDKLMISNFLGVDMYALYANVSKELPFAFIAQSLTSVVTPTIVRLLNNKKLTDFRKVWSDYLQFGYTVAWPLSIGAIFFAPTFISFLYSKKYLTAEGLQVFRIYLIATMLRFTYFGLVPSALGKTKIILRYSIFSMLINVCLNYLLFYWLGIIGPSIATVISMIIPAIFYFRRSVLDTGSNFWEIIKIREALLLVAESAVIGLVCSKIYERLCAATAVNALILGILFYGLYAIAVFGINYRNIRMLLRRLNTKYE